MTKRIPLHSLLIVAALVTLTGAATGLVTTAAGAASAPTGLRQGNGYRLPNGDFVGYYLTRSGTKVYCLSPRKALPASVTMATVSRLPGASATVSRQLTYALGRWGNPSDRVQAAAESQLLNTIVGNRADVRRRAASLPASVARTVAHRLLLTRRLAGPYRVDVHLPGALLPGQSAVGVARLISAAGHAVPGARFAVEGSRNVAVQAHVRAGAGGVARFRYRVTDIGTVHISATATGLATTAVRTNRPASYEQRMVATAGTTRASGYTVFHRSPRGFSGGYSCSTACAGNPVVTLSACADRSVAARRMVWRAGSHRVVLTFEPSRGTLCRSTTVRLADRDRVGGYWQFRTAHGWSRAVRARGTFVVDCPPVPAVSVQLSYTCTSARLTVALAPNGSSHPEVLEIGGAAQRRIVATRGQQAVFSTSVSCTSPQTYTARAGIERSNGSFHFGPLATIGTPHQ